MHKPRLRHPVTFRIALRLKAGSALEALSHTRLAPAVPQQLKRAHPAARLMFVAGEDSDDRVALSARVRELAASGAVEAAWIEPLTVEPWDPEPASGIAVALHAEPAQSAAPDLMLRQEYLDNVTGIDIWFAWSMNISGWWVKIADIEWSYLLDHPDLRQPGRLIEVLPSPDATFRDHGAAVLGVMFGSQGDVSDARGIVGGVFGADACYAVSELVLGRPAGIAEGLKHLGPGDVFLIEMQTIGEGADDLVPGDFDRSAWDMIQVATSAGIIVVLTAGNGNVDLDGAYYDEYRGRGDNGAIRVGAGTRLGRDKAPFSTYGSPVHVQGTGDWSVFTTGYGDFANYGPDDTYTAGFSGTSSAGPIVATAAVAIQSWYKIKTGGSVLTPIQMRELLISTGKPQGSGGHIGPLPDLRAALTAAYRELREPGRQARGFDLPASAEELEAMAIHESDVGRPGVQAQLSGVGEQAIERFKAIGLAMEAINKRVLRGKVSQNGS